MDKKEGGTVMAAIAFWQNSGSRNGGFTWRATKTGILGRRSMSGRQLYFSSFKGQRGIVDKPVENLFAGETGFFSTSLICSLKIAIWAVKCIGTTCNSGSL